MAYVTSSRSSLGASLADRFAALFQRIAVAGQRRRIYSQTLRELSQLSERELADLGLHRSAIRSVALEAAYGA